MIPAVINVIASGGAGSAGDATGGASGNAASSEGENSSPFAKTFAEVRENQREAQQASAGGKPKAEEPAAPAETPRESRAASTTGNEDIRPAQTEDSVIGEAVLGAIALAKNAFENLPDLSEDSDALLAALQDQLGQQDAQGEDKATGLIALLLANKGAEQPASNDNPAPQDDISDNDADVVDASLLALLLNAAPQDPQQNSAASLAGGEGNDLLADAVTTPVAAQKDNLPKAAQEVLDALANSGFDPSQQSDADADAAARIDALLAAAQAKNTAPDSAAKNASALTEVVVPLAPQAKQQASARTENADSAALALPSDDSVETDNVIADRLADFLKGLKFPQEKSDGARKDAEVTQLKNVLSATAGQTQSKATDESQGTNSNVVPLNNTPAPSLGDAFASSAGEGAKAKGIDTTLPTLQGDATPQPSALATADTKQPVQDAQFAKLVQAAPTTQDKPVDQVKVQIQNMNQQGIDRITIQMQPPELGRVHVRMDISPEGHTTGITITASNQSTLDLLQRDSRDLAKALQQAGIDMESGNMQFNLQQQNPQGGGFFGQDNSSQNSTPFSLDANGNPIDAATAAANEEILAGEYLLTLDRGLDIRV